MAWGYAGALIGIDLDNTLINYDRLFLKLAIEHELLPSDFTGAKRQVRDRVRTLPDGEKAWQRLQAEAYGPAIAGASLADGALDFICQAILAGARVAIVSHKTPYANLANDRINLHDAALKWLRLHRIVHQGAVMEEDVYFEETRSLKVERIAALRCTHFIDDLEEVLNDPGFPSGVERILLGSPSEKSLHGYAAYASFWEIARAFGY